MAHGAEHSVHAAKHSSHGSGSGRSMVGELAAGMADLLWEAGAGAVYEGFSEAGKIVSLDNKSKGKSH